MSNANKRAPGLGDIALPAQELESPDFVLDRDYASFSIDEARKAAYHHLDIHDFEHLDTKANRARIQQFTPQWIGELLLHPPFPHPVIYPYRKSSSSKTVYSVTLSPTEALFLGRQPDAFGPGAIESARRRIADMRHPDFETIPDPPERWRVLQTYIDESIQPKRRATYLLYGASRNRDSNGEAARRIDRLNHVQFVREQVIHPALDDLCLANGWQARDQELLHDVVDFRLFFNGRSGDRRIEWLQWHDVLSPFLQRKHELFKQHVEVAKKHSDMLMEIGGVAVSAAAVQ